MEYWYRYRDDLWKRVTTNDYKESDIFRPPKPEAEKTKDNIRRAARMVEAYALCNEWDWFVTLTLNKNLRDRRDLDGFRNDFMQLIRDYRKKIPSMEAVLVPELHRNKDGWHLHGLIKGLPESELRPFTIKEKLPKYIREQLKQGKQVYDWPKYRNSFGWVDVEAIRNRDASARYITKYLSKDYQEITAKEIETGKHLYFVTRGLILPERMENAPGCVPDAFPDSLTEGNSYQYDYGEVQWYVSQEYSSMKRG